MIDNVHCRGNMLSPSAQMTTMEGDGSTAAKIDKVCAAASMQRRATVHHILDDFQLKHNPCLNFPRFFNLRMHFQLCDLQSMRYGSSEPFREGFKYNFYVVFVLLRNISLDMLKGFNEWGDILRSRELGRGWEYLRIARHLFETWEKYWNSGDVNLRKRNHTDVG